VAGALLGAIALLPGTSLEQAFGRAPHSLAWGPALFRTLLAVHAAALILGSFLMEHKPSPTTRVAVSRKAYAVLGGLTMLAILLRIPSLDSCLWLDEVLTMARYARWPLERIFTSFPDQNQHMLFSLLAHCSLRVFGEHAWALRLPSVLFGIGSLWGLFLMGRRLVGQTEALIACALMTVSYHHIWFSQNARGYMGLLFFTAVGTWLWLEAMERNAWRTWIAYAITIAFGMWIHMTMLFVVAAHASIFLVAWLRSGRQAARLIPALAAFALCATLTLQVYALALPEFSRTAVSEFSPASEWVHPMWVVREMLRSLQVGFAGSAVVFCGALLVAAGFLGILRRQPYAACAMVLPAILGAASMLLLGHNLWPRFFFFCMGFGLLIVIHGAIELPRILLGIAGLKAWAPRTGYALAGLLIVASLATVPRCYALPKQDFTGARDYVERQRGPADRVVVVGLAVYAYAEYYAPDWTVAATGIDLTAFEQSGQRLFVVYTLPIDLKAAHPDIWKIVASDFETIKVFPGTLGGGEVYVCRERAGLGRLVMEAR
jgi:hypothetical protein